MKKKKISIFLFLFPSLISRDWMMMMEVLLLDCVLYITRTPLTTPSFFNEIKWWKSTTKPKTNNPKTILRILINEREFKKKKHPILSIIEKLRSKNTLHFTPHIWITYDMNTVLWTELRKNKNGHFIDSTILWAIVRYKQK